MTQNTTAPSLNSVRESARLHCLRRMKILDTDADEAFDSITRAASRHFNVPISLVSFVDEHRQWFKSRVGLNVCETARSHSFCAHAITNREILVVVDATKDDRFADNPLVTGSPHIRFYAGAPVTVDGHDLGTLCIIDTEPRQFGPEEKSELQRMAHLVKRQIKFSARMVGRNPVEIAGSR